MKKQTERLVTFSLNQKVAWRDEEFDYMTGLVMKYDPGPFVVKSIRVVEPLYCLDEDQRYPLSLGWAELIEEHPKNEPHKSACYGGAAHPQALTIKTEDGSKTYTVSGAWLKPA